VGSIFSEITVQTARKRTTDSETLCDFCCFKEDFGGDYGCALGNEPTDDCESFVLGFGKEEEER